MTAMIVCYQREKKQNWLPLPQRTEDEMKQTTRRRHHQIPTLDRNRGIKIHRDTSVASRKGLAFKNVTNVTKKREFKCSSQTPNHVTSSSTYFIKCIS